MRKKRVRRQGPVSTPTSLRAEVTTLIGLHAQEVGEKAEEIKKHLVAAADELGEVRRILGEIV